MNKQSTHSTVSGELAHLDRGEPLISRQRRELHDAIDQLYLGTRLDETQMAQLDELESVEQAVSRARRQLHEQIDELRAHIGLPRWREQHDL
jgi:signal transduction histidine kinase